MTIALVIAVLIMLLGLAGSLLPLLPGPPIIWLGALFYAWQTKFEPVGWGTLAVLGGLGLIAATTDMWVSALGQKASGESWLASLLSLIGGMIGLFVLGLPGMLLGSIAGVLVPNWRRWQERGYVITISWRTIKTWLVSTLIQAGLGVVMIIIFLVQAL